MTVPTIRVSTAADLPELQRLLDRRADQDQAHDPSAAERRFELVVDAPGGGLCAVAIVALVPPQAHLEALAIDERCASPQLERRLVGVAEALAEAFGCRPLDVPDRSAA